MFVKCEVRLGCVQSTQSSKHVRKRCSSCICGCGCCAYMELESATMSTICPTPTIQHNLNSYAQTRTVCHIGTGKVVRSERLSYLPS